MEELAELEKKYTYEELIKFRNYGNAYYIKNKQYIEQEKKAEKSKGGFWSKLGLGGNSPQNLQLIPITPELLHELQAIIDNKNADVPIAAQIAEVIFSLPPFPFPFPFPFHFFLFVTSSSFVLPMYPSSLFSLLFLFVPHRDVN